MNQPPYSREYAVNETWIKKLLYWADLNYNFLAYLNPNGISYPYDGFKHQLFAAQRSFPLSEASSISDRLHVGIISYDQKNAYEKLSSTNKASVECPDTLFFIPELSVYFEGDMAIIVHPNAATLFDEVERMEFPVFTKITSNASYYPLLTQDAYFETFEKIQEHIFEGDIYEMNYCMSYEGTFEDMDAIGFYLKLCKTSPMPFSSFFKAEDKLVLGASPERFLKKTGNKLIAQPIKGSIKRGNTKAEDDLLADQLRLSPKEQAENLMIVDLMRNDLAKLAEIGTVAVEELFSIYRFEQLSQMISTVSCEIRPSISIEELFRHTFPMGSMTGAPKIKCMELIDRYENFKRGWFSGSVGFIDEHGDFDWNVIIRSIIVDRKDKKFYFAVGSAITSDADAAQEFAECQLKAGAIFGTLMA